MNFPPIAYIHWECNKYFPTDGNGPTQAQLFCYRLVKSHSAMPQVGAPLSEHDQAVVKTACAKFEEAMLSIEEFGKQLKLDGVETGDAKKRKPDAQSEPATKKTKKQPRQPLHRRADGR